MTLPPHLRIGLPTRSCQLSVLITCFGLAACSAVPSSAAAGASPSASRSAPQRPPATQGAPTSEPLKSMVSAALADAAGRSGMAADRLQVVSAEAVTWSDGALGCPQPDRMYTMALQPGYRIVVAAGTRQLSYHAGTQGTPRWCPSDRAVPPAAAEAAR